MKTIFFLLFMALSCFVLAQDGALLFKTNCGACHSVGKGKLVGPDLDGVHNRRTEKWIISFVKSSQTMVKGGDPQAVKVFNENSKIVMPDQKLSDVEIKAILGYIKKNSKPVTPKTQGSTTKPATTEAKKTEVKPVATNASNKSTAEVKTWEPADIQIKSVKFLGEIDPKDLLNPVWNKAIATTVPLAPQKVTYPNLTVQSINEINVKSIYSEKQIAFQISWKDSTKDFTVDADKFCDQLAVQLPVDPYNAPSYMMGNPGGTVHIVHWKAIWQEDCENGFRDVQDVHPNIWVDTYPGQEGELDKSKRVYSKDITAEHVVESQYTNSMPGTYSKNPMSTIKRKTPVEEATAVGFGTLTTQETQQATGWAEWKNGVWTVCIVVPVNTGNIYKAVVNDKTKVAFALWDGYRQNIGGRKHYAPWADVLLLK